MLSIRSIIYTYKIKYKALKWAKKTTRENKSIPKRWWLILKYLKSNNKPSKWEWQWNSMKSIWKCSNKFGRNNKTKKLKNNRRRIRKRRKIKMQFLNSIQGKTLRHLMHQVIKIKKLREQNYSFKLTKMILILIN